VAPQPVTGMKPLTDDHPLCQWDGPLLPLEPVDLEDRIAHGTDKGYQQHRRFKVPVCDSCRNAHRLRRQHERARTREHAAA